jgi:hypothetical protein
MDRPQRPGGHAALARLLGSAIFVMPAGAEGDEIYRSTSTTVEAELTGATLAPDGDDGRAGYIAITTY